MQERLLNHRCVDCNVVADFVLAVDGRLCEKARLVGEKSIDFFAAVPSGALSCWECTGSVGVDGGPYRGVVGFFIMVSSNYPWDVFKFVCNKCLKEVCCLLVLLLGRCVAAEHHRTFDDTALNVPSCVLERSLPEAGGNQCSDSSVRP